MEGILKLRTSSNATPECNFKRISKQGRQQFSCFKANKGYSNIGKFEKKLPVILGVVIKVRSLICMVIIMA